MDAVALVVGLCADSSSRKVILYHYTSNAVLTEDDSRRQLGFRAYRRKKLRRMTFGVAS